MDKIETVWGNVKVISSNLEELSINGFCISLDQISEYVENVNIPSKDFIKRTIEKRLEKEILLSGEEEKISISCIEESHGEEVVASWGICFKMIKHYDRERKRTKFVNLRFACTKRDIPFQIKDHGIWIEIGKKDVQVPIPIYAATESERSRTFNFFGCCLEGIYRRL